jgi:hypothetical protein
MGRYLDEEIERDKPKEPPKRVDVCIYGKI